MKVVVTGANSAVGQAILRCGPKQEVTTNHVCRRGPLRTRRRTDPLGSQAMPNERGPNLVR